jgi:hypothetical protein
LYLPLYRSRGYSLCLYYHESWDGTNFLFLEIKAVWISKKKGEKKKKKEAVFYVNYYNVDGGSNFLRVNLAIDWN